jgi:hypothetical protein
MKNIMKQAGWIFVIIAFAVSAIYAQKEESVEDKINAEPVIKFERTTLKLGKIKYGETDTYWFKFKNEGEKPLILTSVMTSCGCVALSWPKAPIKSGQADSIKIMYNTRQEGTFSKSVRVYSNAENSPVFLRIKGQVEPKNNK